MDFNINQAARIMRAGDELSGTNRKLREAVYSFIEWLFQALDGQYLPGEKFGWIIEKEDRKISLSFGMDVGGWHTVTVNSNKPQTTAIICFCQALAGPEGQKLLNWLEKEVQEKNRYLTAFQLGIEAFRSSVAGKTL